MLNLPRRRFLTQSLQTLSALAVGTVCLRAANGAEAQSNSFRSSVEDASPLSFVQGAFDSPKLTGDDFKKAHHALRGLDSYITSRGGWPTSVSETFDVIIVGGGLAGLLSAREIAQQDNSKKWVVFEQAERFGGLSKSESYDGQAFGLGPAYVGLPEAGSEEERLFNELGLMHEARIETPNEARVLFGGLKDFWRGQTDPLVISSLQRIDVSLRACRASAFPEVPWTPESQLSQQQTAELDRQSALEWLEAQGPLHEHVREYFQLYAWSAFGGSLEEISAAQFLNFAASETRGVMAFPGGNGRLTQALYDSLLHLRPQSLRARTLVLDVIETSDGLEVLIELPSGELRRVACRALMMTAPKYVARQILRKNVGAAQAAAWDSLNYRAYLVANVLVTFPVATPPPAFDVFCLKGVSPEAPSFGRRTDRNCTDLIFAAWAKGRSVPQHVLTLYRPFPLDGARHFLMEFDVEKKKREVAAELQTWLQQLRAGASIEGVRLTLWGHAVPLASRGLISSGALDLIAQPIGRRIVFANQDDAANPAFETCLASAQRAARQLLGVLGTEGSRA
jgi:hypothetical protein